jgi:hypothetical protein
MFGKPLSCDNGAERHMDGKCHRRRWLIHILMERCGNRIGKNKNNNLQHDRDKDCQRCHHLGRHDGNEKL